MPIQIDISGHLPAVGYNLDAMRERVVVLAEMIRAEWIRLAQQNLGTSAMDYIAGIQPVEVDGDWCHIHLVGKFPNDIENGMAPFDMKPGLLAGSNAKVNPKTGKRFNTVPFRHGTPGTTGKRVGMPMPYTGQTKGDKPKSLVYNQARKLKVSSELPNGKTAWGDKTGGFGGLGQRTQLPVPGGRPGSYTWKSSPYQGIYRVGKDYAKRRQYQYTSFRRVSDNSDPSSWWHPGLQPRHLVNQVHLYIGGIVRDLT